MQHLVPRAWARTLIFTLTLIACMGATSWAQSGTVIMGSQQLALDRAGKALGRVVLSAKKVNGKLGYGFFETGCVFGVMLRPGTSASEAFILNAGQSYVFIGGGDDTALNVDVLVRDATGKVVGKDTERDAAPFVLFKPKRTGRYSMSVRLSSSRRGSAFCAVTILRKGGYNLPLERLLQAIAKADAVSNVIFNGVSGGRFNQDSNTWALYGAVLRPGQNVISDPKSYRSAKRIVFAVGDDSIKDLDLHVLNGRQQIIVSDTKRGAGGVLVYQTSRATYSVGLANNSSSGPALVMAILMELPAGVKLPSNTGGTASTSRPNSRPQVASPYVGQWSGEWQDDGNRQEGEVEMTVRPDGSLTGSLLNTTFNATSAIRGYVQANGVIVFNYSYAGMNYAAQGTMNFPSNDDGGIGGRISFKQNGVTFGTARFSLTKDD